jgi:hypothetical protein
MGSEKALEQRPLPKNEYQIITKEHIMCIGNLFFIYYAQGIAIFKNPLNNRKLAIFFVYFFFQSIAKNIKFAINFNLILPN